MFRYVVRRVLLAVLTLAAISVATFALFFLGPANPGSLMCGTGPVCTAEQERRINEGLGLSRPPVEQYVDFMKGVFVGRTVRFGDTPIECPAPCLGVSFRNGEPVMAILERALPVTASIVLGAAVVYWLVGIGLGVISAVRRGTVLDKAAVGFSLSFASMQIFFLGPLLLLVLVYGAGVLPRPRWVSPIEDPAAWFGGMLLPWITLGLINSAQYTRLARAQMLEALSEDFIRTARGERPPGPARLPAARPPGVDHAAGDRRWAGSGEPTRWSGDHGDDVRPVRPGPLHRRRGEHHEPPHHHGDGDADRHARGRWRTSWSTFSTW